MPFVSKTYTNNVPLDALTSLITTLSLSRSDAQRFIAKGRLNHNGVIQTDESAIITGDFAVIIFEPETRGINPVFLSQDFAVFDKPDGLRVHPTNLDPVYTLHDEIRYILGNDANAVHRIDQETSGLVLVSRSKQAEPILKNLFASHQIQKRYYAMVHGHLERSLEIHEPILRNRYPAERINMVVKIDPSGKPSHTFIRPIRYFPESNTTLVEASPKTGRSHQIRVHLFHVKHPIVGDPLYGRNLEEIHRYLENKLPREERLDRCGANRLLLHAHSLEFEYDFKRYRIESSIDFEAECFKAMKK